MVELEEVLSANESARRCDVDYGSDPLNILIEHERQRALEECVSSLLEVLKPLQKLILLRTWQGYGIKDIASEVNRAPATIAGCKKSIRIRLLQEADDQRIEELGAALEVEGNKRRRGKRYKEMRREYERRCSVRNALCKLKDVLKNECWSPRREYKKENADFLFERLMKVPIGYKEGVENGRRVLKTVVECRLKDYFKESFGDEKTVCPLCKKCKAV
ncbi:MAG: hypothetical protein IJ668_06095 [Selenomonadaceae bacterium]|nr:hypothetical protein [Selenomonadaceae bacterium]